jgi:hypothetical protein
MIQQFVALERRTSRSGKDTVDHGVGGHDDVANAVAGAIWLAADGAGFSLEQWARLFAGTDQAATEPDRPAPLPWHRSEKEREPPAETGDLMTIYNETRAKMENGFVDGKTKICPRCGKPVDRSGTRISDGVSHFHVGCR